MNTQTTSSASTASDSDDSDDDGQWFINLFRCPSCDAEWHDEWSCIVNNDCPECEARDIEPYDSKQVGDDPDDEEVA